MWIINRPASFVVFFATFNRIIKVSWSISAIKIKQTHKESLASEVGEVRWGGLWTDGRLRAASLPCYHPESPFKKPGKILCWQIILAGRYKWEGGNTIHSNLGELTILGVLLLWERQSQIPSIHQMRILCEDRTRCFGIRGIMAR